MNSLVREKTWFYIPGSFLKAQPCGRSRLPLLFVPHLETTIRVFAVTLQDRRGQSLFQMSKLKLGEGVVCSESQQGVGRLGPDQGLSPAGGAGSQHWQLLNLSEGGAQDGHLSASFRDVGLTRRLPVGEQAFGSSMLHALPPALLQKGV